MSAIVNLCINKCDYIQQVYDDINKRYYGTDDCCTDKKITLCDLLLACSEINTINLPNIITINSTCSTTIDCSSIITSVISISCNKIDLTEI